MTIRNQFPAIDAGRSEADVMRRGLQVELLPRFFRTKLHIFAALILLTAIACSGGSGDGGKKDGASLIPAVEAVQAKYGALPLTERLSGLVKAKNQVEIYPEISAPIVGVYVENGELVKKGQIIVKLRDKDLIERLNQAKAAYRIADAQTKQAAAELSKVQAELARVKSLSLKNLVSDAELENIQAEASSAEANMDLANARVEQARATVDEREETLSRTLIPAPITGTIGDRNAEIGMLVNSNTRLFTIGDIEQVRAEVVLTDQMLNYIQTGQRSEIITENSLYGSLSAPLSRISPFLHPVTHSTKAEIDIANPDGVLIPGMFVTVDIYYGESESATLVPLSALYENPVSGITGVYVTQDSLNQEAVASIDDEQKTPLSNPVTFQFVPVRIIARGRMQAGIEGITPGQWIITVGQDLLGGENGQARVRSVDWDWVERLQNLQRQDLMLDLINNRHESVQDTTT